MTDRVAKYPTKAIILAAGFGSRMQPLTLKIPKPLVQVGGRTLLDRTLDQLPQYVTQVVVNIHHLGEKIAAHLALQQGQRSFEIIISDETDALLDSGGGVVNALPYLGKDPFFILNADTFWQDSGKPTLERLAKAFDANVMDMLLLTVRHDQAAFRERGDFLYDDQGRLRRAAPRASSEQCEAGFGQKMRQTQETKADMQFEKSASCSNEPEQLSRKVKERFSDKNLRSKNKELEQLGEPSETKTALEAVIYGGALIVHPRVFDHMSPHVHSLNKYFDRAIARGKLFGLPFKGRWYTLTTEHAIAIVDNLLAQT